MLFLGVGEEGVVVWVMLPVGEFWYVEGVFIIIVVFGGWSFGLFGFLEKLGVY